jgi:endonuclease/exonuclease/phosphatase family metal-dependent hydrolase
MVVPTPQPLTIANWNTLNFFNDKTDDPSGLDQPGDFSLLSTAEYIGKKKAVAGVLHSLAPDIAVLQEIENESVMNELRAELELLGDIYPHAALIPTSDIREIVILSKVPIDSIKSHQDDEFVKSGTFAPKYTYTRDCLEAHITFNGRHIVILGVHFRSKLDDDPDKRLAEAEHTRVIADAIALADPEAGIVVLGDFNDTPPSPPYAAVLGAAEAAFTNVSVLALPESSRWTYDYKGQLELIDHQMSNPVLAKMLDAASIQILHTPAVEDASDHAPVIATYKVN